MKKAIIDASSAIILFKAGLIDDLSRRYNMVLAVSVSREITRNGYPGAESFRHRLADRRWRILSLPKHGIADDVENGNLGRGEKDTISLYLLGAGDFVIIDDRRGAVACRDRAIPYISALVYPRILYVTLSISDTEYGKMTRRILSVGRYSPTIVDTAKNLTREHLASFFSP
jgi:predicted nucleic acid-binding protein